MLIEVEVLCVVDVLIDVLELVLDVEKLVLVELVEIEVLVD